jgi:hypothetical protein
VIYNVLYRKKDNKILAIHSGSNAEDGTEIRYTDKNVQTMLPTGYPLKDVGVISCSSNSLRKMLNPSRRVILVEETLEKKSDEE